MRRVLAILLLTSALASVATVAGAQSDTLDIIDVDDSDYPVVEVAVAVPRQLADVAVPPDAFTIAENGEELGRPSLGRTTDAVGAEQQAAPRTVLVIDTSGSMRDRIDSALAAASDFVRGLRPGSEVAVVTFGDKPRVETDFTDDVTIVLNSIASITVDPSAETALFDGVRRANRLLPGGPDVPENIVVLSDGGDTVSSATLERTVTELGRKGATLWAVGLETGESNFDALAALAGDDSRVVSADNTGQLQQIYQSLASDVSSQYLLRYDSQATGDTTITVSVDYDVVQATAEYETELTGAPAPEPAAPIRIANPDPYTVTVPLLGTTTAFRLGMASLASAGALIVVLVATTPLASAGRRRLLPAGAQARTRLTAVAEWMTDEADRRLRDAKLGGTIDRALEDAALNIRTGELMVGVLSMTVVAFAIGLAAANVLVGLILALIVPLATRVVLSSRRRKRQSAFEEQFVDVLQLLAGSLRAGHGLLQGIDAVARDAQDPAASEFRRILIEHRLGRDLAVAMNNCADRMASVDFRWVVQAIEIHRDVGGDLARVLDNIVGTVRERAAVHRQVRALSAEGRMSARVLLALPFLMVLLISFVDPGYFTQLTSRPIGLALIFIAVTMLAIGTFVISKMIKIRY